jgi:hypothetical protein
MTVLRDVIEPLAALERGAGSPGERQAAEMLLEMFREAGALEARIDEADFRGENYARMLLPLGVAGLLSGILVSRGRRLLGGALAATSLGLTIDDVENRRRIYRNTFVKPQPTQNVVAECGDLGAERTLVVLAHHDAAPTGHAFDPSGQRWLARTFPGVVASRDTALPIWWPVVSGPVVTLTAALLGRPGLARLGIALSTFSGALGLDIGRHRIVPGANDNLTGCAALVALAERFRDEPVTGVRVLLASCGAEEVLQGGIYGFAEQYLEGRDPSQTFVLNLDSIGCPELILVEGEGPFFMHDYCDPSWRDRIAEVTERATGAPLRRGPRARASTDAIITSHAGFPSASFASWEPDTKLISNYHLMTDTADNVIYETVERAVVIAEALARDLAARP